MKAIVSVVDVPGRCLTARDYKTLCLATLGGLLEFYDFIIFVFFANTIGELFFPPEIPDWLRQFQTFGIFAAGYLARPLGGLLTWMLSAAIVVIILLTPALLQKVYGVPAIVALRANSLASLALTAGCVLAGRLTDRFGPGRVLMFGCPLLSVAAYLLYTAGTLDPWLTTFLYTLAGLTVGIVAVVPCVMIAMFPPTIRFSGISFSYNLAYAIFGGLTPIFVGWLLSFNRLAPAHYVGVLCLVGAAIGVFLVAQASPYKLGKEG